MYKSAEMWWRLSIFSVSTPNEAFFRASSKDLQPQAPQTGWNGAASTFMVCLNRKARGQKQRFAQIRPVTSGCGWSSHPSPQAELRTNATSGGPSPPSMPDMIPGSSCKSVWGSIKSSSPTE